MDLETYENFDLPIPEELKGKLTQGAEVQYWILMERKMIAQMRSSES